MSTKEHITSCGTVTPAIARTDPVPAEIIMEQHMTTVNRNFTDGANVDASAVMTSAVNNTSSQDTALSFFSGPTFTAASVSPVTIQSTPATYVPVQVPDVSDTAFTQTPAFAAPLIYPPIFNSTYTASLPATPCTFLSATSPVTAVCHCIYAQPCALHHRPITYTPHSFSSLGTVQATVSPSHPHSVPAASLANSVAQLPSLPPTLTFSPLRSSTVRLKRANDAHPPSTDVESTATINGRLQKVRRVEQPVSETGLSHQSPHRHNNIRSSEISSANSSGPSLISVFCCECRSRTATCIPCPCHHHHHHHICPRHPLCFCQRNEQATSYRRETGINPMHDMLLSSRMAQIERQQQANNLWFQRQPLTSGNLVGVDVVARRVTSHPLVILPRQQQPIMELAMVLLQPHDSAAVFGGGVPPSSDPLPVGATAEQISRFSTMYRYVKTRNVIENEQERCTICLNDFESKEEVRTLRCSHIFHVACIDRWLIYNKKCPVCRLDLDKSS